jgi:hypothetical protein
MGRYAPDMEQLAGSSCCYRPVPRGRMDQRPVLGFDGMIGLHQLGSPEAAAA